MKFLIQFILKMFNLKKLKQIPAASRRALLTDRREMRNDCEANLLEKGRQNSFFGFAVLSKPNVLF